ncbi:hypothetical protein [Dyella mobilis]|uniref:Uncharacterized protein n=1 Tax=Dyella mobilis TaxID=1849582 RepID=A0ABS2KKS0_9GAMM|nr:hypothetical protein [Dyella mobilis]MBM7131756.1 hypothetical protein [Dyella mobilis]
MACNKAWMWATASSGLMWAGLSVSATLLDSPAERPSTGFSFVIGATTFAGLGAGFFATGFFGAEGVFAAFFAGALFCTFGAAPLLAAFLTAFSATFFTVFFTAFLLAACLLVDLRATDFFAALLTTRFAACLLVAAFFTVFFCPAAAFGTAFFLIEPAVLGALRAADFFAADLRVVAMRAYSDGNQ